MAARAVAGHDRRLQPVQAQGFERGASAARRLRGRSRGRRAPRRSSTRCTPSETAPLHAAEADFTPRTVRRRGTARSRRRHRSGAAVPTPASGPEASRSVTGSALCRVRAWAPTSRARRDNARTSRHASQSSAQRAQQEPTSSCIATTPPRSRRARLDPRDRKGRRARCRPRWRGSRGAGSWRCGFRKCGREVHMRGAERRSEISRHRRREFGSARHSLRRPPRGRRRPTRPRPSLRRGPRPPPPRGPRDARRAQFRPRPARVASASLIVSSERPCRYHCPSSDTLAKSPCHHTSGHRDQYVSR